MALLQITTYLNLPANLYPSISILPLVGLKWNYRNYCISVLGAEPEGMGAAAAVRAAASGPCPPTGGVPGGKVVSGG